jgi:hypothetical protein
MLLLLADATRAQVQAVRGALLLRLLDVMRLRAADELLCCFGCRLLLVVAAAAGYAAAAAGDGA